MRLKQTSALLLASALALLLASAMLVGSVGMMNPTEVRAAGETNTFTLTVPADTNITKSGWNDIGSVGVSNVSIASDKKISVTIENGATGRNLVNTTDDSKKVGYEIKTGTATKNAVFGEELVFTKDQTQAIGAVVADFSAAEVGTYEDTINFTATLAEAAPVTYERTGKGALSSANLGAPTEWEYFGITYQVYNAFIPFSSGSSWYDANGFVKALNEASYDGHSDWTLMSPEMVIAYATNGTGARPMPSDRGDVRYLWSYVECDSVTAYCLACNLGILDKGNKSDADSCYGFVVLRRSSTEAAPVTYERTGKGALSSANLGAPTEWEYDGTTYQVYNAFIPFSSGSSWDDANGFVKALNRASYDGHSDWSLLSSEGMATAYATNGTGAMPSDCGDVAGLWSSVEFDSFGAYYLSCSKGYWNMRLKSNADFYYGFVVLRGSSTDAEPVTYERTERRALSSANLGAPTEWEYDGTTYQVYNAFIPFSSGSSWYDAMGFVNALNEASYDGHSDWSLLSSEGMATAYATNGTGAMPSDRGGVDYLWSSVEYNNGFFAYYLHCHYGSWDIHSRPNADSLCGFVVLRGSSN